MGEVGVHVAQVWHRCPVVNQKNVPRIFLLNVDVTGGTGIGSNFGFIWWTS